MKATKPLRRLPFKSPNALWRNSTSYGFSGFRLAIKQNDTPQIQRNLDDLKTNDEFLKSWITVITTQTKKDRRKRLKKDIYKTVAESLKLIKPILDRKMVRVNFSTDGGEAYKKIFATDFDSIIYNLIINSIESFEETKVAERLIEIAVVNI